MLYNFLPIRYNSYMKIIRNAAKCLKCGDTIESTHQHDFVRCSCGNLFVDGGKEYLRRGFVHRSMIEELAEEVDE